MRNKHTPRRGGDTGRHTSSRSAPKKDSKPDKSKGLANHMHVAAVDALNAFVQTDQPKGKDEERAAMKAVGPAADVLLEAAPCDFMFCDDMSVGNKKLPQLPQAHGGKSGLE